MADEAEAAINAALTQPKRAKVDGNEAEARPLDELIAADQYLDKKAARGSGGLGIYRVRIRASGSQ